MAIAFRMCWQGRKKHSRTVQEKCTQWHIAHELFQRFKTTKLRKIKTTHEYITQTDRICYQMNWINQGLGTADRLDGPFNTGS